MRSGRGGKFGWNYPPGAANDPSAPYNQPDHSHDHEWEPLERDFPLFEDGAAIFYEKCHYAEGRYGDGWSCEDIRTTRCELDRIVKVRDNAPDVAYLASEEDQTERYEYIESVFDSFFAHSLNDPCVGSIVDLDPPSDYNDGFVRLRVGDYIAVYKQ